MRFRWLYFLIGIIAGEIAGILVRGFFPPVPGWPFRLSLFIAMAGIVALIVTSGKPTERVGDLVFAAFAGSYLGYAF